MTITAELQSLSPSAIIDVFTLDLANLGGGITHFHAGTNGLLQPIIWQGMTYMPAPIEAEGFDLVTKGSLPRPKMRIANVDGILSAEVAQFDDLVAAKVTRKRTFAKYLDAVNFPGGVNPDADPNQYLADETWYVERKVTENRYVIEWELSSAFDLMGVMLPYRQVIQNSCTWRYRSSECGWTGAYFDKDDLLTANSTSDFCAKRLSSCRARFSGTSVVPFGGFPGAIRYENR